MIVHHRLDGLEEPVAVELVTIAVHHRLDGLEGF